MTIDGTIVTMTAPRRKRRVAANDEKSLRVQEEILERARGAAPRAPSNSDLEAEPPSLSVLLLTLNSSTPSI